MKLFVVLSASAACSVILNIGGAFAQSDPTELTASKVATLIRSGKLTSEELVSALAARIEKNSDLNAFIMFDRDAAIAQARELDHLAKQKKFKGPLHGVPLVVKDNIHVAGIQNTAGTPALRNFRPAANAPIIEKLVKSGAFVLGKTNLHELAFGVTSNNTAFGQVRNAYDRTRFAGGSSGGNGAAIAAHLAPAGIGTDTGGSVRIPAALNGIAGFRPTSGRYSTKGVTPISTTRDSPGTMARTVADLILLDSVITGAKDRVKAANLERVRIGVERAFFFNNVDHETAEIIERALWRLRAAGVEVVEVEMPGFADLVSKSAFAIAFYEAPRALEAYLKKYNTGVNLQELAAQIASPDVKGMFQGGLLPGSKNAVPYAAYGEAMKVHRPALAKLYADTFKRYRIDALAFPATPLPAAPNGSDATVNLNGKGVPTFPTYTRNVNPGTVPGIPNVSVPVARTADGLPVGLALDSAKGSDRRLLGIALAIEDVFGRLPAP